MTEPAPTEQERFFELLEATAAERDTLLEAWEQETPGSRVRLERLLRAHEAAEAQETGAPLDALGSGDAPRLADGTRLDGFEILGVIAEGGMGVVHDARQLNPERRVALKVIRPHLATPTLLRRFEREGELLGRLQHPGIAQVFAAGRSEVAGTGVPWIAMERVEGVPFDEAVGDLSLADRVERLIRVTDAVAHAHQRGIVHRDLKASNVLVTAAGDPKVIDFGIGCLLETGDGTLGRSTEAGQVFGTLPAMSPEQISGDVDQIDVRTDVYALGVLAYETLASRHPLLESDLSLAEAVDRIRNRDPVPLGAHDARLRGDLEAIVGRCLRKDADARYASASALAEDLRRHQRGEPVAARAPSAGYLLGRFARRHRVAVASAALILVVILVALVITTKSLFRALDAEQVAAEEAAVARAEARRFRDVNAMFRDLMSAAALNEGTERDPSALLFDALARLERAEAEGDVLALVGLQESVGLAASRLGLLDDAEHHLEAARDQAAALGERGQEESVRVGISLSRLRFEQGRFEDARDLARAALEGADALQAGGASLKQAAWSALVDAQEYLDDYDGAARTWKEWRDAEVGAGASTLRLASLDLRRGTLAERRGQHDLAETFLRQALKETESELGPDHPRVAAVLSALAVNTGRLGQYEAATGLLQRAIAIRKKTLGDRHALVAHLNQNLGVNLSIRGKHEASRAAFESALSVYRQIYPRHHLRTANLLVNLGSLEKRAGRRERAQELLREGVDSFRARGLRTREAAHGMRTLAGLLPARSEEREALLKEALALQREVLPEDSLDVTNTLSDLGILAYATGRLDEAETRLAEALARHRRLSPHSIHVGLSLINLGAIQRGREKMDEAVATLEEAVEVLEKVMRGEHPSLAQALHHLARAHAGRDDHTAALAALQRSAAIRAKATPKHPAYPMALLHIAKTQAKLGRTEDQNATLKKARGIAEEHGHAELLEEIEKAMKAASEPGS